MNHISVKNRLIINTILPVFFIIVLIILSLYQLGKANQSAETMYLDRVVPLKGLKMISDDYGVFIIDTVNKANLGLISRTQALDNVILAIDDIDIKWAGYIATTLTTEEERLAREAEVLFVAADKSLRQLEDLLRKLPLENITGKLDGFNGVLYSSIDPISEKIAELVDLQLNVAEEEFNHIHNLYNTSVTKLLIIGGVIAAILAFFNINNFSVIRSSLGRLSSVMQQVSQDMNLQVLACDKGPSDLAEISKDFNLMISNINGLVNDINQASNNLAQNAQKMSEISTETNKQVLQQTLEVELVVTAMEEMVCSSREVTQSASNAEGSAQETTLRANTGRDAVEDAVSASTILVGKIDNVNELVLSVEVETDGIGSVIDVINGIAEQTNLLALNAAIEAARAGEQGRGFAVVADEVRTLASRTQSSITEIHNAIERLQTGMKGAVAETKSSQEQANMTGKQVGYTGEVLESIVTSVGSITDMNLVIVSACEEQQHVAEEINRSLNGISDLTKDTKKGAEQLAITSSTVMSLSDDLSRMVSSFKVAS